MKKLFSLFVVLLLTTGLFANGLSLNSIGPKALGMGGAFVGLADDGSAIYWNPAGLSWQAKAIHASVADIIPMAKYEYETYAIEAEAKKNHYVSPNIFANYKMGNIGLGFGIYVPAGLGAEWDGEDLLAFNGPAAFDPGGNFPNAFYGIEFDWMSEIAVIDFSPAISYAVNEKFSVGLAANIYYGMLELKRGADFFGYDLDPTSAGFGTFAMGAEDGMLDTQQAIDVTGLGFGAALGLMYKPMDNLSIGLSYRSPVNVEFEGDAAFENAAFAAIPIPGLTEEMAEIDTELDIEWPTWIAGGLAYEATEKLTITLDAQYSQWSSLDKIDVILQFPDALGGETEEEMVLEWEDQTQIRFGAQYALRPCLDLRGGLYYDPAPSPDETLTILFPSGTYTVVTGGFGFHKNNFVVDFGAEYLIGGERDVEASPHNMPGKHNIDIFAFSFGAGYKF
ncbi:MAG: outer membrane protein transport protein [Candidatus Cloacimonetes bacterium]|nr:outer membrane protein transport protein [Candidatus Cloacimonadota bacterium]MCF7812851.1 outer membrane protein transport protein [Candidatus Cloacimonadota bacterium]MCF7867063.1 outer membrane protein transport protein [Candidatus Cloacimonadota bacterium]MCF7882617.1 outer membrane protein transport protein [Candidatus Cloacimonadota bacterium]